MPHSDVFDATYNRVVDSKKKCRWHTHQHTPTSLCVRARWCFVPTGFIRMGWYGSGVNDPSAGSPTETLLRLLLPLNDKVQATSRR